jgi:DNA-binding NtrC family response regulator
MIRVLVYSGDPKLQPLLAATLGGECQVNVQPEADRLKAVLSNGQTDVVLLDLDANYFDVEEQAKLYEEIAPADASVVAMADDESRSAATELVQNGVFGYCRKPPAMREMRALIRRAYDHAMMKRELESKRRSELGTFEPTSFDGLIGSSAPIKRVCDLITRVADLNASVLIIGESGTGKELIARAIHNLGSRAKLPFIPVSCGAIPETLIESELFGHEKGAFTGSTGTRMGYFEQAGAGTLFLDEIGELSLLTQVKLLRILQQREFMRLGSNRPIPLKARVILATHRDLGQMVSEGKFRLDLYYRINVMTINAPSLADHPEDISILAGHFLRKYSDAYSKQVTSISPSAMQILENYDWPGNVRELENVIQGSIIRTDGDTIWPQDLPEPLQDRDPVALNGDYPKLGSFERLLRDYKVKLAMKAIEDCNGNKTMAARSLDISRAYLHRLIRLSGQVDTADVA